MLTCWLHVFLRQALCSEGLELIAVLVKQPIQRNTVVLENTLGILRNISRYVPRQAILQI